MLLFLNKDNVMLGHKNFIQEMKKNQTPNGRNK